MKFINKLNYLKLGSCQDDTNNKCLTTSMTNCLECSSATVCVKCHNNKYL